MMALITNQICDLEDALDFTSFELFFPDMGEKVACSQLDFPNPWGSINGPDVQYYNYGLSRG